jgi:hypothetical protein
MGCVREIHTNIYLRSPQQLANRQTCKFKDYINLTRKTEFKNLWSYVYGNGRCLIEIANCSNCAVGSWRGLLVGWHWVSFDIVIAGKVTWKYICIFTMSIAGGGIQTVFRAIRTGSLPIPVAAQSKATASLLRLWFEYRYRHGYLICERCVLSLEVSATS